eukprot:1300496-Rhodomonas_salina.2
MPSAPRRPPTRAQGRDRLPEQREGGRESGSGEREVSGRERGGTVQGDLELLQHLVRLPARAHPARAAAGESERRERERERGRRTERERERERERETERETTTILRAATQDSKSLSLSEHGGRERGGECGGSGADEAGLEGLLVVDVA